MTEILKRRLEEMGLGHWKIGSLEFIWNLELGI